MKFARLTKEPSTTSKYWIHTSKGGYNKCILVNNKTGSCIPNCTAYVYGRWMQSQKITNCELPTCNAESWINKNTIYKEGSTPKLGSVVVWGKGKIGDASDGAGHVEFVEKVNNDGSIETSGSAYNGTRWFTKKYKKGYKRSGYTFLGFIYPPVEFTTTQRYSGTLPKLPSRGYFKKGDSGIEVKHLQKFLNWANDDNLSTDGILGDKTIKSVKLFQKAVNLKQDGLFGNNCLSKAKLFEK